MVRIDKDHWIKTVSKNDPCIQSFKVTGKQLQDKSD